MKIPAVAKTIVAGVIAVLGSVTPLIGDDVLSSTDVVQIALFVLGALGVYVVPNKREDIPNSPELIGKGEVDLDTRF